MKKYYEVDGYRAPVRTRFSGVYEKLTVRGWEAMTDIRSVHERGEEITEAEAKKMAGEVPLDWTD